jgi:hypothetical protein
LFRSQGATYAGSSSLPRCSQTTASSASLPTKVVVLAGAGDGDALVSAVEAGACAVVAKNKDAEAS